MKRTLLLAITTVVILIQVACSANSEQVTIPVKPESMETEYQDMWQFAADCLTKDGIWYSVYYEAAEPDFGLEVELCEKQLN